MQSYDISTVCANNLTKIISNTHSLLINVNKSDVLKYL